MKIQILTTITAAVLIASIASTGQAAKPSKHRLIHTDSAAHSIQNPGQNPGRRGGDSEPFNGRKGGDSEPFNGRKGGDSEPFNGRKGGDSEPFNG